jgi:hypothetical protein
VYPTAPPGKADRWRPVAIDAGEERTKQEPGQAGFFSARTQLARLGMDKKRAERQFNWQAISEAVQRMRPELIAASEAAHKAKEAELDEAELELARTLELGYLVDCLGGTCGPHLTVLSEIAHALDELHDAGGDRVHEKTPPH